METSVIRLPKAAARLLRQLHPVLEELLGPATARKWAIGGGTVLAARWQHRESHDIDVFAAEDVYRRAVANYLRARQHMDQRMGRRPLRQAWPVTADISHRDHYMKWTLPIGDVDLIRSPRDFALTARPETIAGTRIEAMTSEEILLGKIAGRGRNLKARDFYDLAWAEEHDPDLMIRVWGKAPTLAKHQIIARARAIEADPGPREPMIGIQDDRLLRQAPGLVMQRVQAALPARQAQPPPDSLATHIPGEPGTRVEVTPPEEHRQPDNPPGYERD